MLRLYDTALDAVAPLEPRHPGQVSMYVCGPTVYGDPHVGHGRFNLIWDTIRRYLTWSGLDVTYVSNITDIDDKIINLAIAEGRPAAEVAVHYEQMWFDTMARLGIDRPTETPHATEYVDDMLKLIAELIDRGKAYVGGDAVYFSVETVEDYGLLARQPLESLKAGARVQVSEEAGKREPIDFALWKFAKPGEPKWESPWGDGRPGWHTECVVMALDLLGENFDLHGGGQDLAFPHHENERAQAVADARGFSRRWVHSGMVNAEGDVKMSKSLGNTLSLTELLDVYDPRALRLLVLQSHYRRPMIVQDRNLRDAEAALKRLDTFARDFARARAAAPDPGALDRFRDRMDDDLDTPNAVGEAFKWVTEARAQQSDAVAAAVFEVFEHALGIPLNSDIADVPEEALAKARHRDEARAAKDWGRADAIRVELQADGWIVEDGPEGTTIRR